ncbi:MAG: FAD-dependent oxidoreductase [Candidatus Omnitrophota bacterium]|nr:FAD-dependent oxidoreductase [Candidatus Omnitrophota bacterium]
MIYDLIIIGAGPAGITASVYAARLGLKFLVITKDIGGQAAASGDVENYTGYQFITGPELAAKFEEHLRKFSIELRENEAVIDIKKDDGGIISVKSEKNNYFARAAIVASGKRSRMLNVPGEIEFKNRGLTYCAICDGPLFKGKDVAVIGGGNSALDAVLQLIRIAKRIYIVNIASDFTADKTMLEEVKIAKNVTALHNAKVSAIIGDKFVKAIKLDIQGIDKEISVEGVFVEIGLIPNSEFAPIVARNKHNEIKIDSYNRSDAAGIFAAGDVTDVAEKQIIIAAGEGAKAALSVFKYLAQPGKLTNSGAVRYS